MIGILAVRNVVFDFGGVLVRWRPVELIEDCRYGLNEAFRSALTAGTLRVTAEDAAGSVRAVELEGHPFYVAVLFQLERAALRGEEVPLAVALLRAAVATAV